MQEPNNILVIIVARIGDTLLATPTIRSLHEHYPAARITVLAHPGRKTVLENLPFIDELGKITKKMAPFKGYLGGKPYDLCIVYSKDTALLAYARRVSKKVITFKHDQHKSLPDLEFVTPPSEATHAVIERLMLLAPLNIETQNLRVAYQITEQEKTWARQWIQEAFGHTPDTLIGIQDRKSVV